MSFSHQLLFTHINYNLIREMGNTVELRLEIMFNKFKQEITYTVSIGRTFMTPTQ